MIPLEHFAFILCGMVVLLIQIRGKNFVTSVYVQEFTHANYAKWYRKAFPSDVKGLQFDVYSNYLLKSIFL